MFGLSEPLTFTVNFPSHLLSTARSFQQQQRSPKKAEQVYLNTLAVYAVQFYCECMGVEADLSEGDSWDPAMQTLLDTADLVLPDGILECRPILPDAQTCPVPAEVQENRKGYVVVEVDTQKNEAKLLGFAKTAATGTLLRSELQSIDALIDEVIDAEPALSKIQSAKEAVEQISARLSNWLEAQFEQLWQPSDALLVPSYRGSSPSTDNTLERTKRLKVGEHNVLLTIKVDSIDEKTLSVLIKVCSQEESTLPAGLTLDVLDDESDVAMSTTARESDDFRALDFEIETGETFFIRIAIGDKSVTEQFIS